MENEIKTEDIINNLRQCSGGIGYMGCLECTLEGSDHPCDDGGCSCEDNHSCEDDLMGLAADRLKQLSNQHIKIQYCSEELTISEMCGRMDELRKKVNAARLENELLRGTLAEMNETYDRTSCDERIMRQAIETYGVQAQCDVAIEEMAELTKAIVKIRRVADDYGKTQAALDNLMEEIADVDIMIDQ